MDPTSSDILGQPAIFNEFLKWYKDCQNSGSIASVAHSSTPFVGLTPILLVLRFLTQVPPIILLVINLFFSRVSSHGVGTIHLLPSLSIDNVFFMFLGLPLTFYPLVV